MTLGYKFVEIVIRKLFEKKFKYLGVLGSKAKIKTHLKNLEKRISIKPNYNEYIHRLE